MEVCLKKSAVLDLEKALDAKWYDRFEAIGSFQVHEFLNPDRVSIHSEMQLFFSGQKINPEFQYPDIDLAQLEMKEKSLTELKAQIINEEENSVVSLVYGWKINEKLAGIGLLKAAKQGELDRFKKYSRFIYGEPSLDIFAQSLSVIKNAIAKISGHGSDELNSAAKSFLEVLPLFTAPLQEFTDRHESTIELPTLPKKSLVKKVADRMEIKLKAFLGSSYERIKREVKGNNREFTPDEIKQLFKEVLTNIKAEDWNLVYQKGRRTFSVDQSKKQLNIPNRHDTAQRVLELVTHEVGIHLSRRLNGECSQLKLLGLGLDRYVRGGEGLASLAEDAIKPVLKDFFGLDRHLAISLALGLDGKKRDFRDVFSIMQSYHYFIQLRLGRRPEVAKEAANRAAWTNCFRTFRGTDFKTPGVCLTRDMLYREGNIRMWQFVDSISEEEFETRMGLLESGKFDPTNTRHLWALIRLGIVDSDVGLTDEQLKEMDKEYGFLDTN